jgi:hypothetical protein
MRMLTEYLDDDLPASERAAVTAHLQACAACRAEEAALRRAEAALTTLAVVERAPDLTADLHHRIAALSRLRARPLRWAWAAAPLAAGVIAAALLLKSHYPTEPQTNRAPRVAQVAVEPAAAKPAVPSTVPAPPVLAQAARPARTAAQRHVRRYAMARRSLSRRYARHHRLRRLPREAEVAQVPGDIAARQKPLPSSRYYAEVTLPDGTKSVLQQDVQRDASGNPRAIFIVCENIAPEEPVKKGG